MQIYEALKKDHEKVKALLAKLIALHEDDDNARREYLEQIRDELIPHSRAEESVFYNSLRSVDAGKKIAMHGYRDHMEAEGLLRLLQIRDKMDIEWKDNARKLRDAVENHIKDEEETVFAFAKSILTDQEAEMMAASFERLKPELKEQGIIQTTWEMVANLMPPRFKNSFQGLNKSSRH